MGYPSSFSVQPLMVESVSTVTATNSVQLGTKVIWNGQEYSYVYNAGNSQISPGYGAILSAVSGYSVTVSSTTQVDTLFGVCQHATLTTATYGWLLTRGFSNIKNGMADTAVAAGDNLILAANGAFAAATSTAIPYPQVRVMAATGSAGTAYAYIKAWG